MKTDYELITEALQNGVETDWEEYALLIDSFPDGQNMLTGDHWINDAIAIGSVASVKWMVSKNVNLDICDAGFTPVLSVLDREGEERYELLEFLLQNKAPVNAKGGNDWTPLHKAAVAEDLRAMELLLQYGADPNIRTEIDDYATPLEEARYLGKMEAVRFLENHSKT